MIKKVWFLCWAVCFNAYSFAQKDYFQQEVNYTIDVTLNDQKHTLSAYEKIEYINNSDSTLTYLWFHIWPNAYKNHETALAKQLLDNGAVKFYFSQEEDRGYIDSLNFKVDGQAIEWQYHPAYIDVCKLILPKPLLPGDKIVIETPFFVKLPKGIFSRLGHMGESYQITQWYPKPAVFDKKGWHEMPYLNQGEFYSEFGSFDVKITLPKNYVVGSTGDLQTPSEIEWLNKKANEDSSKSFEKPSKKEKSDWEAFPESSNEIKTLHYKQNKVHDFAWFADKRWHVLKGEVELPNSKRKVTTWSMFTDREAHLWKNSIEYINDAVYYYSLWNGDYPYNQMTAVDGALTAGGGMEYPNVTVIGGTGRAFALETVIMHETGHQWFYGVLGSNERDYAWMDEGINTFNEMRYIQTKYPKATVLGTDESKMLQMFDLDRPQRLQYYLGYVFMARQNKDQPLNIRADQFTSGNYGAMVYYKTGASFYYLKSYLGEEQFDNVMKKYFQKWKFKHPQPEDLRKLFEYETGEDLSWFFDDLLASDKKLDYKMKKVLHVPHEDSLIHAVKVKNKGEITAPLSIAAFDDNDSMVYKIWYLPQDNSKTMNFGLPTYSSKQTLKIDPDNEMLELRSKNNSIRTTGLFKKVEPLKLQNTFSIERGSRSQILLTPTSGWNKYDKWMFGLGFYNSFVPTQNFEYQLFPLYALGTKEINDYAHIAYSLYCNEGKINKIKMGINHAKYSFFNTDQGYAYFMKMAPYVNIDFKKKTLRSKNHSQVYLRYFNINETAKFNGTNFNNINDYVKLEYLFSHSDKITPIDVKVEIEQKLKTSNSSTDFAKLSLTANKKLYYSSKATSISFRLFAGTFIYNNTINPRYNWRMDGDNGISSAGAFLDYTYDNVFIGRSETTGLLSQQFYHGQGDFKVSTPLGQSNEWLVAANIKADLPFSRSLGIYADVGYNATNTMLFNAGGYIEILGGIAEVYLPFAYSQNIKEVPSFEGKTYFEKVRFILNLDMFNVFKLAGSAIQ